jgi:pyruvate/2-oxoglutarate dehydrogenase complex dihydrolipoamide dehydrogenase (E3) component
MLGGADGFLKLIFHSETLKLLGVHCIGDGATEIIHIGQVHYLTIYYIMSVSSMQTCTHLYIRANKLLVLLVRHKQ